MPIKKAIKDLSNTLSTMKKPGGTSVSMSNAKKWNAPGGGYDQWKKLDPQREKALPIGGMAPRTTPAPKPMSPLAVPRSFKKGGVVKKTGMAKVHKGEIVIPNKPKAPKAPRMPKAKAAKMNSKKMAKQRPSMTMSKRRMPKLPPQLPQAPQPMDQGQDQQMPTDPGDNQ